MNKRLVAKPSVRKTSRVVQIPKSVRAKSLKPSSNLTKIIKSIQAKKSKPSPKQIQAQRAKNLAGKVTPQQLVKPASSRHVIKKRRNQLSQRQGIKKINRGPKVTYQNNYLSKVDMQKLDQIKNCGKDKILVIIGNGPSIVETELEKLAGNPIIDIMSINKPDQRVWPTRYWLYCDRTQYNRNEGLWKKYTGIIINTANTKNKKSNTYVIKNISGQGFSENLKTGFHIGRSSVFAAMQVANWMNYEHVYIFGCDMSAVTINGQEMMHFYGENPDVQPRNRANRFDKEAEYYAQAAKKLSSKIRSQFTFCSSYLKYKFADKFNKMDHKIAVGIILDHMKDIEEENETD